MGFGCNGAQVCYEGDVSRLLDLCRVRLVVSGPAAAAAAVAAVAADGGVRVVRVKDSLSRRRAAGFSSGFGFLVRSRSPAAPPRPALSPHCASWGWGGRGENGGWGKKMKGGFAFLLNSAFIASCRLSFSLDATGGIS